MSLSKLYRGLVQAKKDFIEHVKVTCPLPQSVKLYAREMFLNASECDNNVFMLPPLTRDSASRKGIYYRTEKIIV